MTHQSGSAAMFAPVCSGIVKMLWLWSLLDYDCEIFFPHDNHGLPRGYLSQAENKESDHQNEMT